MEPPTTQKLLQPTPSSNPKPAPPAVDARRGPALFPIVGIGASAGGLREISVDSGEVAVARGASVLRANAIGSCVVVAAYDPNAGIGGMAHVMLPGASGAPNPSLKTKYAEDAMQEMMRKMAALGADGSRVRVCLIGGANVLGNGHDSPGPEIVESLNTILRGHGIVPAATEVGGMQRRSCTFDLPRRRVTCTVGDSAERTLWEARASDSGSAEENRVDRPLKQDGR